MKHPRTCLLAVSLSVFIPLVLGAPIPAPALAPINASSAMCRDVRNQFYLTCPEFVVRTVTDGKAGNLTTAKYKELVEEESSLDPKPTAECCSCLKLYMMEGCRCDGNDEESSRSIGVPPGGLKAELVYMAKACDLPLSLDVAYTTCPADPPVAAMEDEADLAPVPKLAPVPAPAPAPSKGRKMK